MNECLRYLLWDPGDLDPVLQEGEIGDLEKIDKNIQQELKSYFWSLETNFFLNLGDEGDPDEIKLDWA